MKVIHLDANQIPSHLKNMGGYKGKKFRAVITDSVECSGMQWDGGSRSTYSYIDLATGQVSSTSDRRPFLENQSGFITANTSPGIAIVEHAIFRGKDFGLIFYVHPDNAPLLIPQQEELKLDLLIVLAYTSSLKNSYGGRKNIRFTEACRDTRITADRWEAAKAALIEQGYLRANGSITPKGRNAAPSVSETRMKVKERV